MRSTYDIAEDLERESRAHGEKTPRFRRLLAEYDEAEDFARSMRISVARRSGPARIAPTRGASDALG
jgi:hypothetical protein